MRKALIYTVMMLLSVMASAQGKLVQMGPSFIQPLQERDSVLIADQLFYGFELKQVEEGTRIILPQLKDTLMTNIRIVKPFSLDTVKVDGQWGDRPDLLDLKGGVVITSFDEGTYYLPPLAVLRVSEGSVVDTLVFDPQVLDIVTMPVDTASFVPHDIKEPINYPYTFAEVAPWVGGGLGLCGLIYLIIWLIIRHRRKQTQGQKKEPAYIVALRKLDQYRGNKLWAPQKQKMFYSGITDALREYISERYGIGAMEMTTAEIFKDMKDTDVPHELLAELKELFELADFVKFAKFTASDDENANALPVAVRFVTSTYQAELDKEKSEELQQAVSSEQLSEKAAEDEAGAEIKESKEEE